MTDLNTHGPRPGQKTALVTGAGAGGIGGSIATQLHEAGYFVLCAVRRPSTVTPQMSGMALVEMDVTSTESVAAAVKRISSLVGDRLDVLVNNAGSATHRPALDLDVDGVVASMFDVNVLGVMRVVKALSDLLIAARGCIVNIGSVAPIVPLAFSSAYNATKAAIHAYGDTLRIEMCPFGVDVVTVVTGSVRSNLVRESDPSLPSGSRYLPVQKFWLQRVNMSQSAPMDTDDYAREVVGMICRTKRPVWFWAGESASWIRLLYHLVPKRLRLFLVGRKFGLNLLGKKVD